MKSFKELFVWQRSMRVAKKIYAVTNNFPSEEKFGLAIQMRRSAVSIPSNIAEGHTRQTKKEFRQFLAIARGSVAELETQLILAEELGYVNKESFVALQQEIETLAKMMSSLYGKI